MQFYVIYTFVYVKQIFFVIFYKVRVIFIMTLKVRKVDKNVNQKTDQSQLLFQKEKHNCRNSFLKLSFNILRYNQYTMKRQNLQRLRRQVIKRKQTSYLYFLILILVYKIILRESSPHFQSYWKKINELKIFIGLDNLKEIPNQNAIRHRNPSVRMSG